MGTDVVLRLVGFLSGFFFPQPKCYRCLSQAPRIHLSFQTSLATAVQLHYPRHLLEIGFLAMLIYTVSWLLLVALQHFKLLASVKRANTKPSLSNLFRQRQTRQGEILVPPLDKWYWQNDIKKLREQRNSREVLWKVMIQIKNI